MKKQTVFLADDGKSFNTRKECADYEKKLTLEKQKKGISDNILAWLGKLHGIDGIPYTTRELTVVDEVLLKVIADPKKFFAEVMKKPAKKRAKKPKAAQINNDPAAKVKKV